MKEPPKFIKENAEEQNPIRQRESFQRDGNSKRITQEPLKDFLKPIMASVLTARTNKAGNKIVPDARKAFGSPTDAVTDAEVASRFATAASRVRSDGGGAEARRTLDASGYRLSSRGLSY